MITALTPRVTCFLASVKVHSLHLMIVIFTVKHQSTNVLLWAVLHLPNLAWELAQPILYEHICCFLFQELYPDLAMPQNMKDDGMPEPSCRLKLGMHLCASAVFYTSTKVLGPDRMYCEIIWTTPLWYRKFPCYDTVFVMVDPNVWSMICYQVACIQQLQLWNHPWVIQ